MALVDVVSGEKPLPNFHREHLLVVSPHGGSGEGSVWGCFKRARIPHDLIISKGPHRLMPSPWALGFQQMNSGGDTNIHL